MSKTKESIIIFCLLVFAVALGGVFATKLSNSGLTAGYVGGGSAFGGSSTNGEVSVATTDTNIVPRDSGRTFLRVCKTNASSTDTRQITFAINSSASHGRGFLLDGTTRCMTFTDEDMVTGLLEAVASPSAASISYSTW